MRYKPWCVPLLLAVSFSASVCGQTPADLPGPTPLPVDCPKGKRWVVRVVRSVDSLQRFPGYYDTFKVSNNRFGGDKRQVKLSAAEIKGTESFVMSPKVFMTESQLDYGCLDCLSPQSRSGGASPMEKDRKYSGFWVPTTAGLPSPELVQIAATILSINSE